ncbi:response regulator transcription factor [Niabella aquatica]
MRILIIEDEIIIARFIEDKINENFNCSTVIALNREEVLNSLPAFLPHLIVCDINLEEDKDGIVLIEELRQQYVFEVIFITSYQSKGMIERALTHQPLNYIIKPVDEATIFAGLKLAWPSLIANQGIGKLREASSFEQVLSATELKVIRLIAQNKGTQEIASDLFISPHTVKNHRHRICRKLNLKDENSALTKWALLHKDQIAGSIAEN